MRSPTVTTPVLHRFTPPAGLSRSAPRDVRLTSGGRALTLLSWLLVVAAVVAGVLLYREAQRRANADLALEQHGVSTLATVDRLWRKSGDNKPSFAALHFMAEGTRIDAEVRMQPAAWRQLRVGSTLPVRYRADDPRRFAVNGARRDRLPFAVAYLAAGLLGGLALLCAAMLRQQRSLLMEGRAAPGIVTEITTHRGSHGSAHRHMTYEFPLLGGGTATGKAAASKTHEVGAAICVVYDPDRPRRNQPYPFSLVAPDEGE